MSTGCAIIGAAETAQIGKVPDMSVLGLNVHAGWRALDDAGLTGSDIDGVASNTNAHGVADAMGIRPRWIDTTSVGGCSFMVHVRHAVAAIRAGYARRVLITHGESGRSKVGQVPRPRDPASITGQFEEPYGARAPYLKFTLPALRYMHDNDLGERDLAEVVVAQRRWSSLNPRAGRRELLTADDILAAPLVAYPFHVPEVCMVADGGGAIVVTASDDIPPAAQGRAVPVLGTGESTDSIMISEQRDAGISSAIRIAADDAFREAGVLRDDVGHVMSYDAFAHLPWIGLESMGFTPSGTAATLINGGHTSPGGRLPLNTNGGGLAYTHTGMYGMFAIQESLRQLRGEADAQVPDLELSVALGIGGMLSAAGVLVLARSERQQQ
jgi:acetyl-CoA acetyltransferase